MCEYHVHRQDWQSILADFCFGEEMDDWAGKVYHKSGKLKPKAQDDWFKVKAQVWRRAGGRCERCDKLTFLNRGGSTAHHIIPREAGDNSDITNLIWLCYNCHNYVEDNVSFLTTRALIVASFIEIIPEPEIPVETDWHAWVYGGARNPMIGDY